MVTISSALACTEDGFGIMKIRAVFHLEVLLIIHLLLYDRVANMEDICMPKAVFFSEPQEGKRDRGASRKR